MNSSPILTRASLAFAATSRLRLVSPTIRVSSVACRLQSPAVAIPARTFSFSSNKNPGAKADNTASSSSPSQNDSHAASSNSDAPTKPLGKVSGLVNTILHGSGSGPKMQSQESWGVSLARGKYIHELQKHHVRPERFDDYVKLLSEEFPRIIKESNNRVRLTGSWTTEIGELDSAGKVLGQSQPDIDSSPPSSSPLTSPDFTAIADGLTKKHEKQHHQKFIKQLRSMLVKRENQICLEFAFWKSRPPVALGGIYEMRSYLLKPGNLLEWEANWRRGLECRRQFCEPVGAWFSQLGTLNYVHHVWNYPDLETRKKTREQAWKVDGWAETVYNTVRLIERMEANILIPMDFSSLK
ncbi:hypothetical protein BGW41_003680 [Actinomortierella wolfii]|nr:hypothetical protein BGW41_003680 [Actinomortierella wolfii]